jgi:SAM-dependent methyltransferase
VRRTYPQRNWLIGYLCDVVYAHYRDDCRYISGRLIDIGCGSKPYEDFWAPVVDRHIGIDHPTTLHDRSRIDAYATAYAIPFADGSFDSAICNAVIEHLEEPEAALRECFRILRRGGIALYSAPFIWHHHEEPRDFYRYSRYGLSYLLTKVGFEVIEIRALSGFWATFGQLLVYNLERFDRGVLRWLRLVKGAGLLIQGFSFLLDSWDRSEQWTWMHVAVVRKP